MWPLKSKPVVDSDTAAWHAENFAWLVRQFGGQRTFSQTELILPKPGFFPSEGETGHALALRIFTQVKAYCGMADWEVRLVADDNPLAQPAAPSLAMVSPRKHALGTFSLNGNVATISYVPALLRQPQSFIATMAHELAHYLLAAAPERPICDNDELEFLTDLTAIYLGFGVFLANSRFEFQGLQDHMLQGWQMRTSGYLPEADIVYALALFLRAKEDDGQGACGSLKPHLAKLLRRAMRDLSDHDANLADIRRALADQPDISFAND